jgi:DNA topoisomerase I
MKLVIVESPTKAKTLSKILNKEYEIKSSYGHIRDLPKSGLGVDVTHNFDPEYVVSEKAQKTLTELKKAAKDADTIILASDPDREGEAIAWHLRELLGKKKGGPVFKRVVFHELTKTALDEAFAHPGELNMDLVDAQQGRRVLDRLVGYKLSPLLWKKVRFGLSAGRVQSVAVRLVVEKERERNAFNIEEYWSVDTSFTDEKGKRPFTAELVSKETIPNENIATKLKEDILNDTFQVDEVKKSERKKNPNPPLKTSTLQQVMSNQYGFTAKKTMMSAQKLFEHGFITYHRTDSLNLAPEFISTTRSFIQTNFGKNYLPDTPNLYKTKEKNAQEAHEAIRPTDLNRLPGHLKTMTLDEVKVYTIIWKRAVESQMTNAIYDQTSMTIVSEKGYKFKATGSVIRFDGWLATDTFLGIKEPSSEINPIPEYAEKEGVLVAAINPIQHFTQPPARYSDATLIKTLEEMGIGRPSTYAPTLSTIQVRGYVIKDGRYFVPTDVAYVVNDLLVNNFPKIVDYDFTAKMEDSLDDVAEGKIKWVPVIRDFYVPFEKDLIEKDKLLQKQDVTTLEVTDKKCPECGNVLNVKLGKFGKFLSCSNYPECKYAEPLEEDKVLDENGKEISDFGKCPNCDTGNLILRKGKFGKFLACSNYPKCKTALPFLEKIGVPCPKCKDGDVVLKKAKGREFFGCSKYPECDFSSWQDPRNPDFKYDPEKHSGNLKKAKREAAIIAKGGTVEKVEVAPIVKVKKTTAKKPAKKKK